MKYTLIYSSIFGLLSFHTHANSFKAIEIITISGAKQHNAISIEHAQAEPAKPDVSQWLKSVPGANTNQNGPITGIAQYRGLYGDRIATTISGQTIRGAGPNAMDSPLSYVNPELVEAMSVYRAIAPVSSALDSLGGTVEIDLKTAKVTSQTEQWQMGGQLNANYSHNNQASSISGDINISRQGFAGFAYLNQQQADDYKNGSDQIVQPSQYDKTLMGAAVAFENQYSGSTLKWDKVDTKPTGTAALPMDIDYIQSDHFGLTGFSELDSWQLDWRYSYQDARHGMDNYSQRLNQMPEMYRYNTADMTGHSYSITAQNKSWQFGFEGIRSEHSSVISNPDNAMFSIVNFNNVLDERHSVFAQYNLQKEKLTNTFGIRLKHNQADADEISHSMAMMNPHLKMLQDNFNQADRSVSDTTFDLSYHGRYTYSDPLSFNYAMAIKQRAPSYQERYLWLPMQATGGLADGKTYIGQIDLDPETAYQINLGINYQNANFSLAPQVFYQKIDNYIQGTPIESAHIKMVAGMMGDDSPLMFDNIDATLYGADLNWQYYINNQWQLSGLASYVRGTRDDIDDDLYRIAPLNGQLSLHLTLDKIVSRITFNVYQKQTRVSDINNEKHSTGYGTLNWHSDYYASDAFAISVGVNNLFDKDHHEHLAGLNRANGNAMAVGEPITAIGRNAYFTIDYQF